MLLNWTDPGQGGFYDQLGTPSHNEHLVPGEGARQDPSFYHTPVAQFKASKDRLSWQIYAQTFYDDHLTLRYTRLDTNATYRLKIVFAGGAVTRLVVNGHYILHDYQPPLKPTQPMEWKIPHNETSTGNVEISCNQKPNLGGSGRTCQIAEVWLIKEL